MYQQEQNRALEYVLSHRWVPVAIVVLVTILMAADIRHDLAIGTTALHVLTELLMVILAAVVAFCLWRRLAVSLRREERLQRDLEQARDTPHWQAQQRDLLYQFSHAITAQFDAWEFTPSEKEIAFLLLKGLSMKELATLRGSTPHSIRQQAHTLYHKAGLGGRAELSAYFLGGLLPPRLGLPENKNAA